MLSRRSPNPNGPDVSLIRRPHPQTHSPRRCAPTGPTAPSPFCSARTFRILAKPHPRNRNIMQPHPQLAALRFHWADRTEPLALARDVAGRSHYFPPDQALSGGSLVGPYEGGCT